MIDRTSRTINSGTKDTAAACMNVIQTERLVLRHLDLNDDAFILDLLGPELKLFGPAQSGIRP